MTEKKKLNKVSWASGSKLCQVKVIRKADTSPKVAPKMSNNHLPSKFGPKMPNIPKRRIPSNFPTSCPSAYVPYKKESNVNQLKHKLPQIKWKIPPSFVLESEWLVASGEESEETKVQKLRESNVLEALYPHISAIPPRPSSPLDVEEDRCFNDSQTPVIPIIPIEEAESSAASPPKSLNNMLPSKSVLLPNPSNDLKPAPVEGDTLLAAVAAVNAIMRSMDPGSMIDTDLLVKFLKDPELTLQLINEHQSAANNVSGPYESKMLEPSNTEPGRKAIEEKVLAPMLTSTPSVLTNPLGQLTKTTTGERDRVVKSGQDPLTQFNVTKTGTTGGGSITDLPSKEFNSAQSHMEMVKSEMVKILNPNIPPTIVAGTGLESCFTFNPHIMHTDNAATVQFQQCRMKNTEKVAFDFPRSPTHTVVGERTYETGLTTPIYTFSNYASGRQEPVATSGLVTVKQQLPQPRLPAGLYTNAELKDEHGGHNRVTRAHALRINPTVSNPSPQDLSVFKRMIRNYGLSDNSTGSEPLATQKDNSALPTQHSSVFGAPVFSANANVPQLKYFSYYQSLAEQHGETQNKWDNHQQAPPHTQSSNMHINKPKTQETCFYFNTTKGCRNGSTCLFRHEVFDQKRPMDVATHEAPDPKRVKLGLGREIIGRT